MMNKSLLESITEEVNKMVPSRLWTPEFEQDLILYKLWHDRGVGGPIKPLAIALLAVKHNLYPESHATTYTVTTPTTSDIGIDEVLLMDTKPERKQESEVEQTKRKRGRPRKITP